MAGRAVFRSYGPLFVWVVVTIWTGLIAFGVASSWLGAGGDVSNMPENAWVSLALLAGGVVGCILAFRRPISSVTVEDGRLTAELRWPWSAQQFVHPLAQVGEPRFLDEDDGEGGRIHSAVIALPDGRDIVFSRHVRRSKVEADIDRFRAAVRQARPPRH